MGFSNWQPRRWLGTTLAAVGVVGFVWIAWQSTHSLSADEREFIGTWDCTAPVSGASQTWYFKSNHWFRLTSSEHKPCVGRWRVADERLIIDIESIPGAWSFRQRSVDLLLGFWFAERTTRTRFAPNWKSPNSLELELETVTPHRTFALTRI